MRTLHDIAHCRAGDKGDTSILSLFVYREEDFELVVEQVTAGAVTAHLKDTVRGEVTRHVLPQLGALQFVCAHALAGGVTTSTALDTHGKALSFALLAMPIESKAAR
ncbi:MAG: hypothetical protein H7125_01530 [Proteobacteria bacterium]|nr:hypothetical protein [Burkholderiales bacterium]